MFYPTCKLDNFLQFQCMSIKQVYKGIKTYGRKLYFNKLTTYVILLEWIDNI